MLQGILGVNWKTTLSGVTVILGVITKIIAEVHAKDWSAVLADAPNLLVDITAVLIGVGLIHAKDNDTTGIGVSASK
jgi:hypothetical protein